MRPAPGSSPPGLAMFRDRFDGWPLAAAVIIMAGGLHIRQREHNASCSLD